MSEGKIQVYGKKSTGPRASKLFFCLCPPGGVSLGYTKWSNPGLSWPILSRAADAERTVIRIVIGGGRRSAWQRSGRKSGANRLQRHRLVAVAERYRR